MTKHFTPRKARGIQLVRADGSSPAAILAEMKRTFEQFKADHELELKGVKAKFDDVVQKEKVDRINTEISELTKALDQTNSAIAALKVGGAGGSDMDPAKAEHSQVFSKWFRRGDRAIDANMHDLEVKAGLSTDSNPDGGYLMPEEMSQTIDRVVGTVSVMRSIANTMEVSSDTYKKLVNIGGADSGWVGEKGKRLETATPQLIELIINTQELYANPATTQKALDDARLDLAKWLADEVSIEFAEQEGAAFINGDGANKPRGILGYDKIANASHKWGKLGFITTGKAGGFADTDPADCLIDTYYALKQAHRNGASWLMSDATMGSIRKLKDADGNYLWATPAGTAEVPTILQKPVHTDDGMDKVEAGNFPIAFGDFKRGYLIIDRFGTRVLRDPFTNKPYIHFYTTKRVGGGVVNFEAIKLLKVSV